MLNISTLLNCDSTPDYRFEGRVAFAELVRLGFAKANHQGWREIVICDNNFEDWPLGERSVAQSLNDWSKTGRKFTMLAKNYTEVTRRHARFVQWRRTWAHIVECRACPAAFVDDMPCAFWTPLWVFERLDLVRSTGIASSQTSQRVLLKEKINQLLAKSSLSFPAYTLGL